MKSRKEKESEYKMKYGEVPKDYNDRLSYMVDKYNVKEKQMDQIIQRKNNMMNNLSMYQYLLVLFEIPQATARHRYRIINKKNYVNAALQNQSYVHVYQPRAHEDQTFMKRLLGNELAQLNVFVQTPCTVQISNYFPFPSNYNTSDRFIAEYGLDWCTKKPDWDNIGKKYSDMYNNNIWLDDKLVFGGQVYKYYSELPRVEILIQYLNVAQNIQTYRSIVSQKDYRHDHEISYIDRTGNIIF